MTKDEALKLALEALEGVLDDAPKVLDASIAGGLYEVVQCRDAITAIKEVLAQPEQEPVAWMDSDGFPWSKQGIECRTTKDTYTPLYTIPPRLKQEHAAHAVIAGALFDFMGWLTSREERIVLSSADEASPAVDAITDFAKVRGLSLDDAKVQDWNTTPPQRKPLTDEEVEKIIKANMSLQMNLAGIRQDFEAAHGIKEKNT